MSQNGEENAAMSLLRRGASDETGRKEMRTDETPRKEME